MDIGEERAFEYSWAFESVGWGACGPDPDPGRLWWRRRWWERRRERRRGGYWGRRDQSGRWRRGRLGPDRHRGFQHGVAHHPGGGRGVQPAEPGRADNRRRVGHRRRLRGVLQRRYPDL